MAEKKSSLKKYLETQKKPTVILGPVERMLLNEVNDRDTTVLHPSEFTKGEWCPREGWFLLKGDTKIEAPPGLQLASVYSEGHGIHEKWQRWLQKAGLLIEAEVPVTYPGFRVHGHGDGLLGLPNVDHMERVALLEIKSIGIGTLRANRFQIQNGLAYSFRLITRPFPTHIRQAMFYAWVLNKILPPEHQIQSLIFIYECKEDQAAREFEVKYDEEYLHGVLEKLRMLFPDEDGVLVAHPPACINDEKCPCRSY